MPKIISDVAISELSAILVKGTDDQPWGARNPSAVVLGTKGGPTGEASAKPDGFLAKFASALKGYFVLDDTPDTIDGDGDGAEDYEQILRLFTQFSYDFQTAMYSLSDDKMRSAAIVAGVDTFLASLDDIRTGGDGMTGKGGARHSKKDLAAMSEMVDSAVAHAKQMKDLHAKLTGAEKADAKAEGESAAGGKDGEGRDDTGKGAATQGATTTAVADATQGATATATAAVATAPTDAQPADKGAPGAPAATTEVSPSAEPAVAAPALDAAALAAALGDTVKAQMTQMADTMKAALAEQSASVDSRLAAHLEATTKAAQTTSASTLAQNVAALKAAQVDTAPGALPMLDAAALHAGEQRWKAHPLFAVDNAEAVRAANSANPPTTIADVVRNSRAVTAVQA